MKDYNLTLRNLRVSHTLRIPKEDKKKIVCLPQTDDFFTTTPRGERFQSMTWHCKGSSCAAIGWRCRLLGARRETDSYMAIKLNGTLKRSQTHSQDGASIRTRATIQRRQWQAAAKEPAV